MEKFRSFTGLCVALSRPNIDTDQIIPKQFLRSVKRTGFGSFLFSEWRYAKPVDLDTDVSKVALKSDFALNQKRYRGAQILLAGPNFGCGSSREHAVWALQEFGFKAIIAAGFGDIFRSNASKNGLLTIKLGSAAVGKLIDRCEQNPGFSLKIDLRAQTIADKQGKSTRFRIDKATKHRLMEGLDDIALTLQHEALIQDHEAMRFASEPWLYHPGQGVDK